MNKFKLVRRGKRFIVRVSNESTDFDASSVETWLEECKITYEVKLPTTGCWDKKQNYYWHYNYFDFSESEWDFDYYFNNKSDAIAFMLRWL